ncbi:MAG TPA: TlpA disulfide reductase family protein [Thermoanaerobaculia bacterium]|nr:TlpA disulfide reductase family protein [Thermoanaerobaculia bacterium]
MIAQPLLHECSDPLRSTFAAAHDRIRRGATLLLLLALTIAPCAFAKSQERLTQAPDFSLPGASGTVSLHDFRGKVVLIDFWASWCVPCRQSFPWMTSMMNRYGAQGLEIIAVNLDKKRDAADRFIEAFPATFPVVFDPSGKTAEGFRVEAMPSSFLVSRTGEIIHIYAGFDPGHVQTIETQIQEALSK